MDKLKNLESNNVSYKQFKKQFLPTHRKATFAEYSRFRKFEKLIAEYL
jgi:hypothetical protein